VPLDRSRISAILFDVDGTLSDTDDLWVRRLSGVLRHFGFIFPEPQPLVAARWMVMGMETPGNLVYELLDRLHLDDEAGKLASVLARREPGRQKILPAIHNVVPMVGVLKTRYPLGVVSARGEHSTLDFLQQNGLLSNFGAVATALTCEHTKPFPDPLYWAAERLGVPVERCLMVGDTTVDIRAGKAAGAQTVGVLCGFGSERELRRAGADFILQTTADLAQFLLPQDI